MAKYYATAAGLPNIAVEDHKIPFATSDYVAELRSVLTKKDEHLLDLLLWESENRYLLCFLRSQEIAKEATSGPSLFSYDEIESIIAAHRSDEWGVRVPKYKHLPRYYYTFVEEHLSRLEENGDRSVDMGVAYEDRLAAMYFAYAKSCGNAFLEAWFDLNLNMRNVLAAHTARRLGWDPANYVVGEGPVVECLRSDKTKDFGLSDELGYLPEIMRIAEESNITKRERMIDLFKWNWLEEQCFRNVFDIERLLCFYLQLSIVERWVKLDETTGENTFRQIVGSLKKQSTESLEEFKRNQKK